MAVSPRLSQGARSVKAAATAWRRRADAAAPMDRRTMAAPCRGGRCSTRSGRGTSSRPGPGGRALLYVDRHLVHEGSFHAFEMLRRAGRRVRRPDLTVAVADHYVPTARRPRADPPTPRSGARSTSSSRNAAEWGIALLGPGDPRQGIVHVVGPEQGLTLPGLTVVCGDSHTATHGALGALAFGIGASEVEHVLATQTIWQRRPAVMRVWVDGRLGHGVVRQGPRPPPDRRHRRRRRHGVRARVRGPRGPRALDGRADDPLQHGDRGGLARRDGRAGRDDLRLPRGPAARAAGRRLGTRARRMAGAPVRRGRALRPRGHARRVRGSRRS